MLTIFKTLSSDPNAVNSYLTILVFAIVSLFVLWIASRHFTAKRELALRVNVQRAEETRQVARTSQASPLSVKEAAPEPPETEFKAWWVAATVPADNVSFTIAEPKLERSESIEKRTKPQARGEPIDAAVFPRKLVHNREMDAVERMSTHERRLPCFFYHNYFCIAHEAIDVFQRHDLGNAQFRDLDFFEFGGSDRVNERVKILVPCNPKTGFLLDNSPQVKKKSLGTPALLAAPVASFQYGDGDIAVSKSVLDGADVWIDPTFRNTFFLSDRLVSALKTAGVADDFDLRWARVL